MRLEVESLKARLVTQTQMDGHGTGTLNGVTQIQMQEMVRELSCGPLSLSLSLSSTPSSSLPFLPLLSYYFSQTLYQSYAPKSNINFPRCVQQGEYEKTRSRLMDELNDLRCNICSSKFSTPIIILNVCDRAPQMPIIILFMIYLIWTKGERYPSWKERLLAMWMKRLSRP